MEEYRELKAKLREIRQSSLSVPAKLVLIDSVIESFSFGVEYK